MLSLADVRVQWEAFLYEREPYEMGRSMGMIMDMIMGSTNTSEKRRWKFGNNGRTVLRQAPGSDRVKYDFANERSRRN